MRFILMLGLVCAWGFYAQAESYFQIQGAFRNFPKSGSIEAHAYYNQHLWKASDEGAPWKYGFWRVGGFAAIHGQAGVRVELFPISFLQLSYQQSLTSRFYETQTLDCQTVACGGSLQRGTFRASLALAYGSFFLVPGFALTDLHLDSEERDFSSEEDNLIAYRSGDQLTSTQVALGYKQEGQRWVLLSRASKMKKSHEHNSSHYLLLSRDYNSEINYFVGAGVYESNHVDRGLSMLAGLNWTVGENLSIF